jgi:hypothetical protein
MRQEQIDIAIKAFCNEFKDNPYLHRCEHSLHISLYNKLIKQFSEKFILNNNNNNNNNKLLTSYIHKEFPGRKKNHSSSHKLLPRTQIDVVVLKENQETNSISDFLNGNFEIDYAFEISLEYEMKHLCWDIFKFITGSNKSKDSKNYIIHLYNKNRTKKYFDKKNIDILLKNNTIKTDSIKGVEGCYYLIKLCMNYSKNKDVKDYEKILAIVKDFVKKKNEKYADENLLDTKENMQKKLQQMKFIFFDANPNSQIDNILTNIRILTDTQ